ncbi:DUF4386 family protein [Clostridium felsineum]|uniref:Uncharacterized protein n=1 Tax=Clostridium felsineum TaxID=36839 RepID=A0A1S8L385_9CLOT|nr:DUF4386 family protein [Clostridium felsineum]URZ04313.1 hypothetical protein CLAUR_044020 [Clostridium felsineum]URZ07473.1 hypothetical protein CLROS_028110 [Clostridium felsineum]URZ12504.1 hypothetical protein CROST_032260 [Clostridium felsineum]
MNIITFYKCSGVFIIMVALGFTISQIGISKIFNYPQILRSSTDVILDKFYEGGVRLKFFWLCFAVSSLMLIPLSAIFYEILNRSDTPYLIVGSAFGIASGIFYVLGLMRWIFLADSLSKEYTNKNISADKKETIEVVFKAFHIYCGNSIGETMGFICMGIWISITGISMLGGFIIPAVIGIGFIICGIGIAIGPSEWLGFKIANKINKLAMKILMVLLVIVSIRLIIL